ncbi:MAG: glycoside hydrolase family 2 TIM barrel-domain containing protein [Clostridia bacterium]
MDFNKDWKFKLGDDMCEHLIDLDESDFVSKNIPHDFSIEQPYNQEIGHGCTAYLVGGIGWYRKHFTLNDDYKDKKVFLYFDGIYNRSNIYVNEKFVSFEAYGYSPILLDISDYVAKENVLAVKVDRTRYLDSRWYAGSGIYRKANLLVFEKTYIPVYGVQVTTDIKDNSKATINISTEIQNENSCKAVSVTHEIIDPNGDVVATLQNDLSIDKSAVDTQSVILENPVLWDVYKGNLYTIKTTLSYDGEVKQEKKSKFGVRYFEFTVDNGFFINGRHEYIKGVCLHHEAGAVGSAVPNDVWRRRLLTLKECGCNAIRTAHNPASADFLDLCDELGLLVQEEFFDEWDFPKDKRSNGTEKEVDYISRGHHEFFRDCAKQNLQDTVKRDFNRPSIIQWSLGNEIEWTYPKYNFATGYFGASANGNYFFNPPPFTVEQIRENCAKIPRDLYEIGDTAKKLSNWTKEIDTSRPITANCILPSASYESGYTDALDMVGFSYRRVMYNRCHEHYPDKPIMGAENVAQWHEWKAVLENDFIAGIFLWTGIDYLGEAGRRGNWPIKLTSSGLLDVAGFEKTSYHMFKTLWQDKPYTYMTTQTLEKSLYALSGNSLVEKTDDDRTWETRLWTFQDMNDHYNYDENEPIVVEAYSNCDSLTLLQNGNEVSTLYLKDFPDRIYKWCIPFVKGEITVKNIDTSYTLKTAQTACDVQIFADKNSITTDYDSVCNITAKLFDKNGVEVKFEEAEIEFICDGNTTVCGADNGANTFVGDHKCPKIITNKGQALIIIGAKNAGDIKIKANLNGNISNSIQIEVL